MTLLAEDNPILQQISESYTKAEVKTFEAQKFFTQLRNTMIQNNGIGIAAVQVGVLKRVICVHLPDFDHVMINPVIMKRSGTCIINEGCLSFPKKFKNITRPSTITVKWLDRQGKRQYALLDGMAARVIQHEWDHLQGKVFTIYDE